MSRSKLPERIYETRGNHESAVKTVAGLKQYVDTAISQLTHAGKKDEDATVRGGYLRAGDEMLETIIRHANCARDELRIAWNNEYSD